MYRIAIAITGILLFTSCSEAQTQSNSTGSEATEQAQPSVINKVVTAAEFTELMKKENMQLVDVRTPGEYAGGVIGNAVNVDYTASTFQTEIAKLDKDRPTLIYCAAGGRSAKAAKIMKELGFTEVYDLQGGYGRWPNK